MSQFSSFETDRSFKHIHLSLIYISPIVSGVPEAIANSVFRELPMDNIFPELNAHMMEMSVGDNHVFQLIKSVSKSYSKIIMYLSSREFSGKVTGERVRKRLTKLIHFKNQ